MEILGELKRTLSAKRGAEGRGLRTDNLNSSTGLLLGLQTLFRRNTLMSRINLTSVLSKMNSSSLLQVVVSLRVSFKGPRVGLFYRCPKSKSHDVSFYSTSKRVGCSSDSKPKIRCATENEE
jgi:hypothetical protein